MNVQDIAFVVFCSKERKRSRKLNERKEDTLVDLRRNFEKGNVHQ